MSRKKEMFARKLLVKTLKHNSASNSIDTDEYLKYYLPLLINPYSCPCYKDSMRNLVRSYLSPLFQSGSDWITQVTIVRQL